MEKFDDSPTPEQEVKRADYMRKELEQFPFLNNPIEQWSEEEKKKFQKWCGRFNNFYATVGGIVDENSPLLLENDITSMREEYGMSDEDVDEAVKKGSGSKKYYDNSYAEFNKNIRQAIIDSGVEMSELKRISDRKEEFYLMMVSDAKRITEDKDLYNEFIENSVRLYTMLLPAILGLIDGGYTETELTR